VERSDQIRTVREFFEEDAERYWQERYLTPSGEQLSYVTRKRIALGMIGHGPGRVLDIGSGPGIFTRELVSRGFLVCAVDLAFEMLAKARQVVKGQPRSQFAQGDLTGLPFRDATFDRAMCVGVLAYLPELAPALAELARVVRPGGAVVVQTSNRYSPTAAIHRLAKPIYRRLVASPRGRARPVRPFRLRAYSAAELRAALHSAGFRMADLAFYDFRPPLVERFWPVGTVRIASRFQRLERSRALGWLGEGLLVKAVRT
jgi:ubiquinone/menaquinone biosynthesis C-methylase UbiE